MTWSDIPQGDYISHPMPVWPKLRAWEQCVLAGLYRRIATNFLEIERDRGLMAADRYARKLERMADKIATHRKPGPKPKAKNPAATSPATTTETGDTEKDLDLVLAE